MIRFAVPTIGGRHWPGGWTYMRNLVRTLSDFGPQDITTTVFLGPEADAETVELLSGLARTSVVIDPAFIDDRVRTGLARTLLTGRNTPIVSPLEAHGIDVILTPAMLLGRRCGISSLAWFPDFQHHHLPHLFSARQRIRRKIGIRAQIRASDAVLTSSRDAEADCLRFYPSSRGKTGVASFAVPREGWPSLPDARAHLAAAGIEPGFIFLPNQLWLHKNHELVITALARLKAQAGTRRVIVTGGGVEHRRPGWPDELRAMVAQNGVGEMFLMQGNVAHALVRSLMTCADALLNPSRFEGWSTTVEEAKSCGTPMLLSDLGVHREQAAGSAQFFGTDDPDRLATLLLKTPPRTDAEIAAGLDAARDATTQRQREFADALAGLIRRAAARRAGTA